MTMDKLELLLEVGTEEIPARMVKAAAEDLSKLLTKALADKRLSFATAGVKTLWTPRRLVVFVPELAAGQVDLEKELVGPPVKIAVGPDGKLTRAGESFCKTSGVPFENIGHKVTPKGEVLFVKVTEKGRSTQEILAEEIPAAIGSIKFKKSMRWADYEAAFVRPVRWIVAVLGGDIVHFHYGAVRSGNLTWGLRGNQYPLVVTGAKAYFDMLAEQNVAVDPADRKSRISAGLEACAKEAGGTYDPDPALLDEVTNLVECPVPFLGTFDNEFLDLPRELLEVTMKHHQRYFPVVGPDGRLLNHFIGVSNTPVPDQGVVTRGNERVLRARLKDASFFYEEDRKKPLEAFVEKLKGVVFQAKLGTYFDKQERIKKLAAFLTAAVVPGDAGLASDAGRAAGLCKADLVSGMVGEFPELQGVMGRYYAAFSGENDDVASAILEHYWPVGGSGGLPKSPAGVFVSMADKLDTIAGCFHAGLKPTGSADPYALRRAALGIIRIVFDQGEGGRFRGFDLDIDAAAGAAVLNYTSDEKAVATLKAEINAFFKSRLRAYLAESERADVVDAFLDARTTITRINDLKRRFDAFVEFRSEPFFLDFATSFKRAQNITKETGAGAQPDPSLFTEPEEKKLHEAWRKVKAEVDGMLAEKAYKTAMTHIGSSVLGPMHEFFDKVFVEVDDLRVRDNRKALLKQIVLLFSDFADFSRMEFRAAGKS
jgi:glycyl-tRNA synthetase beta chain